MATILSGNLSFVYDTGDGVEKVQDAFARVMAAPWDSSGLPYDNAFTSVLVVRASSFLARVDGIDVNAVLDHKRSETKDPRTKKRGRWGGQTLRDIILKVAADVPSMLALERPQYPASAALAYWFVDGVDRFKLPIPAKSWEAIARWATSVFHRQVSLIAANDDSLKDPIELGMAASLVKRLRTSCEEQDRRIPDADVIAALLPTMLEVRHGVRLFMKFQNAASGTWPKFFPLFHFPDGGANYCLSAEVLEALLREFRSDQIFREEELLRALERAVAWIEATRLSYSVGDVRFHGWNSGGHVASLRAAMPELWATGVVHMFARRALQVLNE
jgi:hypothetical protein